MTSDEMLTKLIAAKDKLDRGEELTAEEQAELEIIGEYIAEVIKEFVRVLQETLAPAIEAIVKAVKELWDSLPPSLQEQLRQKTEPRLQVNLGEVATPYSAAQQRVFQSPYDLGMVQRSSEL